MSTVDIDKDVKYLFWNLVDHYQNDHPDPDQTQECMFAIETIDEIEQLLATQRIHLKAELLAKMPKPTIGAPVDKYETGGECGAYADGYNKAITEITKLVEEL